MLETFGRARPFVNKGRVRIDNLLFLLHYRITTVGFLIFSLIISCHYFWGEHIACFSSEDQVDFPNEVLNAYCYVQSTYTLPGYHDQAVAPGVYPSNTRSRTVNNDQEEDVRYHKFYQWMPLFLFFEGVLFGFPHYLWKSIEHGRLEVLVTYINKPSNDNTESKTLGQFLNRQKRNYKGYAYQYFLCELLNFAHVVAQIYFINVFLDGQFLTLGTQVLEFSKKEQVQRDDPLSRVFPRITKCMLNRYGPTGDLTNSDAFCVLPINLLNEKIFIVLWFWLVVLCVLDGLCVIYHFVLTQSSGIRTYIITIRHGLFKNDFESALEHSDIGFWLLLKRLRENIEPAHFRAVVTEIANRKMIIES